MKELLVNAKYHDKKSLESEVSKYKKLIANTTKQVIASKNKSSGRVIKQLTIRRNKLCEKSLGENAKYKLSKAEKENNMCVYFFSNRKKSKDVKSPSLGRRNLRLQLHTKNDVKFWMSSVVAKMKNNTDYQMLRNHLITCKKLSDKLRGVILYDELLFAYLQTMYTEDGIKTKSIEQKHDFEEKTSRFVGYDNASTVTKYFAAPITPMHLTRLQRLQSVLGEIYFCYDTIRALIGPSVMRRCAFRKKYENMWKSIQSEIELFSFSSSDSFIQKKDDSMKDKLSPSRAAFGVTICVISRFVDAMWAHTCHAASVSTEHSQTQEI